MPVRLMLLCAVVLLAACGTPAATIPKPVNDPTGIVAQNGWTLDSGAETVPFTVPAPGKYDAAAQQQLDASKQIGLDFSTFAGKELSTLVFPLSQKAASGQSLHGNVLMNGADVVGAWLSVDGASSAYALNAKP